MEARRRESEQMEESESGHVPSRDGPAEGTRYSASEIHENIGEEAESEMERSVGELGFSGLASGLLIGFSFLAVALASQLLPPNLHRLASAIGYPLGFVFVVFGRHQLFTENTLEPVIPVLERRDGETMRRMLRLWGIVLPANLIGTLIFGLVVAQTNIVPTELRPMLDRVAEEATRGTVGEILHKGIWAGWLVALMAWLVASTKDTTAQILFVWLATAPIGALGFKHSIAGAGEAFYFASAGRATWADMLLRFELPAVLGNVIGGVVLVAMLNHGQAGKQRR